LLEGVWRKVILLAVGLRDGGCFNSIAWGGAVKGEGVLRFEIIGDWRLEIGDLRFEI
jgi:hypothetical protein